MANPHNKYDVPQLVAELEKVKLERDDLSRQITALQEFCNVSEKVPVKVNKITAPHFDNQQVADIGIFDSLLVWRKIFDAIPDPVFVHDKDFRILRSNDAFARLTGKPIKSLIGKFYWEFFPGMDEPLPSCIQALELDEEKEERIVLDNEKIYNSRSFPLRDTTGNYLSSIHILKDISEQELTEQALHESKKRYSDLFNHMSSGVAIYEANEDGDDFTFTDLNYAGEKIDNVNKEDVLGHSILDAFPGVKKFGLYDVLQRVWRTGKTEHLLSKYYKDKRIQGWRNNDVYKLPCGEIVSIYDDVTERKRTELALRNSEEKFRSINAAAQDAVIMIDNDGEISYWNPAAQRIFGYYSEDVTGKHVHRLLAPEHYLKASEKEFIEFAESGKGAVIGKTLELEARHLDGHVFPVELSVSRLKLNNKWHAVGIVRDITGRKQDEKELMRLNRALLTLSRGNKVLVQSDNEEKLLEQICRVIVEDGGYRMSWVGYAQHDPEKSIKPIAQYGFEEGYLNNLRLCWDEPADSKGLAACPTGRAIVTRQPYIVKQISHVCNDTAWCTEAIDRGYNSLISLPIRNEDQLIGALTIFAAEEDAFDENEVNLLSELADDLNYGIITLRNRKERARLEQSEQFSAQRLQDTLVETIQAMATAVEKRDPYTAGHQKKVALLATIIAEEMGLPSEQVKGIRLGASIHDIGKIYVPAEILNRPGKLTEAEFEIIKSHTHVGYDIIKGINFPWPVGKIILQHHERLDGSGYPNHLKMNEIILEARILAVADVVEAITSYRPYRPGLGISAALDEIEINRGVLYDADVVDVCLMLFREKGFVL